MPEDLRREFVKRIHEAPMHGHTGVSKTTERVARDYYFPGMRKVVEAVLRDCHICRTSKSERHKPYGFLQPNDALITSWQIVIMDFIIKLLSS